jgi:hypothetical protein
MLGVKIIKYYYSGFRDAEKSFNEYATSSLWT